MSDSGIDPQFLKANAFYAPSGKPVEHHLHAFSKGDSFSFKDVLDTLNPLQHIPVVATIYREITGDEPGAVARLAGGALYGGPIGLVISAVDCGVADNTGEDIGEHVVAALGDVFESGSEGGTATAVAKATPPPVAAAAGAGAATLPVPTTLAAGESPAPNAAPRPPVAVHPIQPDAAKTPAPLEVGAAVGVAAAPAATSTADPAPAPARREAQPAAPAPVGTSLPPHFMPVPQRRYVQAVQPAPVNVPVSNDGEMSHVPVTGRPTFTPRALVPASVHGPAPPAGSPKDWFTAAMMSGLDKYQKSNNLVAPPAPATAAP